MGNPRLYARGRKALGREREGGAGGLRIIMGDHINSADDADARAVHGGMAPMWKKGESGNPSGRARGVVYPAEWLRAMADWPVDRVHKVAADSAASISQRAAATVMIQQLESALDRDRRAALETVADRTTGKPAQSVHVIADIPQRGADELLADLQRRYALGNQTRTLPLEQ